MTKIMSGDYSRDMWWAINHAKTKKELREALYFVCCRLQELEVKYDDKIENIEKTFGIKHKENKQWENQNPLDIPQLIDQM